MQSILAVDPGTTQSGWCRYNGADISSGIFENALMRKWIEESGASELAIEMVASYGMPVGREVFETCVWIGRFVQSWRSPELVRLIYRKDVKLHLCGDSRAKDSNIRAALIDRFGALGTKKAPGVLYGTKGDAWQAIALAVTAWDKARAA